MLYINRQIGKLSILLSILEPLTVGSALNIINATKSMHIYRYMPSLCAAFMYFQSAIVFYDSMKSKLTLRYIFTIPRVPTVLEYWYYFKIRAFCAVGACPLLWARIRKEFCESDRAESRAVVLKYLS